MKITKYIIGLSMMAGHSVRLTVLYGSVGNGV